MAIAKDRLVCRLAKCIGIDRHLAQAEAFTVAIAAVVVISPAYATRGKLLHRGLSRTYCVRLTFVAVADTFVEQRCSNFCPPFTPPVFDDKALFTIRVRLDQ